MNARPIKPGQVKPIFTWRRTGKGFFGDGQHTAVVDEDITIVIDRQKTFSGEIYFNATITDSHYFGSPGHTFIRDSLEAAKACAPELLAASMRDRQRIKERCERDFEGRRPSLAEMTAFYLGLGGSK